MGKIDFTECPLYRDCNECTKEIIRLNNTDKAILDKLTTLEINMLASVNDAASIKGSMTTLIEDKKIRDAKQDRRDKIKDRIYGTLLLGAMYAAYDYVSFIKQIMGG